MFTLPQNTIVYLLKEPIDMRYGMFRLQGVIAQLMQQPMPRGAFYFSSTEGTACSKPSGSTAPGCASFTNVWKKALHLASSGLHQ